MPTDLALPDIDKLLQKSEPLDEPVAYRYPISVRNRYDKLTHFPEAWRSLVTRCAPSTRSTGKG